MTSLIRTISNTFSTKSDATLVEPKLSSSTTTTLEYDGSKSPTKMSRSERKKAEREAMTADRLARTAARHEETYKRFPNAVPKGHPERKDRLLGDPTMASYYRGMAPAGGSIG